MNKSKYKYLIIGVPRCGQYAIFNWICGMAGENNTLSDSEVEKTVRYYLSLNDYNDPRVFIFEEYDIELFKKEIFRKYNPFKGRKIKIVIVIRDPFNWLSSVLSHNDLNKPEQVERLMLLYSKYIDEITGRKKFIDCPYIIIKFNYFHTNKNYRRKIAEELNLNFNDKNRNEVLKKGGGSSFDLMTYNGKAEKMNINKRWEHYIDNQIYLTLLKYNPRFVDFSIEQFNFYPPDIEKKIRI